jgi:hypothetical protein
MSIDLDYLRRDRSENSSVHSRLFFFDFRASHITRLLRQKLTGTEILNSGSGQSDFDSSPPFIPVTTLPARPAPSRVERQEAIRARLSREAGTHKSRDTHPVPRTRDNVFRTRAFARGGGGNLLRRRRALDLFPGRPARTTLSLIWKEWWGESPASILICTPCAGCVP